MYIEKTIDERWKELMDLCQQTPGLILEAEEYFDDAELYETFMKVGGIIWCCCHGVICSSSYFCTKCTNNYIKSGIN